MSKKSSGASTTDSFALLQVINASDASNYNFYSRTPGNTGDNSPYSVCWNRQNLNFAPLGLVGGIPNIEVYISNVNIDYELMGILPGATLFL